MGIRNVHSVVRGTRNVHSVPETPSYGTELTLGAKKGLLWYAKRFLKHSV